MFYPMNMEHWASWRQQTNITLSSKQYNWHGIIEHDNTIIVIDIQIKKTMKIIVHFQRVGMSLGVDGKRIYLDNKTGNSAEGCTQL